MDVEEIQDAIIIRLPVHKRIWQWWVPIAHKIGNFQARLILTVFYFTMFMPFAD